VRLALDTSAVAAVVFGEPRAEEMLDVMARYAGALYLGAATRVELGIVVEARQGPAATADLRLVLDSLHVNIVPFDEAQAEIAVAAWRRFGKGRHPAGLNLGDCYSYAVSRSEGVPLLFVGDDFSQTDVLMP
jgi:ribonuclease VapC